MGHVAYSSKNRLFEPVSGHFSPIRPTNPRRERNELPTLATVLPPPASRPTPNLRGEVVCRPSLSRWLPPTTDSRVPRDRTGHDLDERPSLLFSMSPNQAIRASKSNHFSSFRRPTVNHSHAVESFVGIVRATPTGAGEAAEEVPDGGRRCIPIMRTNDRAVRSGSCRENRQRLSK